jgi:hypothetical protein
MSTYNRERYHTPEGKARQKKANQRLAMRRNLAWAWLTENRPDVIQEINNQINKENQQ